MVNLRSRRTGGDGGSDGQEWGGIVVSSARAGVSVVIASSCRLSGEGESKDKNQSQSPSSSGARPRPFA